MTTRSTAARWALAAIAAAAVAAPAVAAGPLKLDIYNPGHDAIFPVSSVLVTGDKDAVLIDAQFGASQAAQVVEKIRASGKNLTTIYISHGDPDFYFGLETIHAAFPAAKIVATAHTVAHIKESAAGKLAYWSPILKTDAPSATLLPEVLMGHTLMLEGKKLEIKGDAQPDRSFVWIPSLKAVVGGIPLANNLHVWMADTQTPASHIGWLAMLDQIQKLKPKVVVPGHYLEGPSPSLNAPKYTASYIRAFDRHTAKSKNSAELIEAMKKEFPTAGEVSSLELSAKVAKGEMKW
ncbi:MBL fold metallo-hydrolase [Rhodoferax sp. WC2427]|uniref:MBL fold metallo-hydrolase n=1 Tax=Rhodoferax sp. WC2427 TaxID=3234144 RepID=UPI003467B596